LPALVVRQRQRRRPLLDQETTMHIMCWRVPEAMATHALRAMFGLLPVS
jgi:hypothetical protein